MIEAPLYGARRVIPAPDQAIRTVADFALMGYGAVFESRALAVSMARDTRVGVTGYSMGGNLAALVSALMPLPVATAPLAASPSPGPVYLDGMLSRAVRWSALGGPDAREALRTLLASVSVLELPVPAHTASAVLVGARRDGFVPPAATESLSRHWPGSELRWVDAGHGTLIGRHRDLLADAVRDAFVRQFGP
jgi:pimeloyl-ACP methyl ester carboxylesterase